MVQLHILLCCVVSGFAAIDLCFDSLILFDPYGCPLSNVQQVQTYYRRTRDTYIVEIISAIILFLALSLFRCAYLRRAPRDLLGLIAFLSIVPYYVFVMEPAEDACLGSRSSSLPEDQIRAGLFKVGIGHTLILVVCVFLSALELEWKIDDQKLKKS